MASFYTAADALIERDGEYLLVKEGKEHVEGALNVPGGGVEHGENPVEAVKREVKEETGLKVKEVEGLIGVLNGRSSQDGHPVLVHVFSCSVEEGGTDPDFSEEIIDAEFLKPEEIDREQLRNDIFLRALKMKERDEMLTVENFSEYSHPFLDREP
jgi:8-oxo-dGTP diphosphatase